MKKLFLLVIVLAFQSEYVRAALPQSARQSARFIAWFRQQTPRTQQQVRTVIRSAELSPDGTPPEVVARQINRLRNLKDQSLNVKKLDNRARPLYAETLQDPQLIAAADQAFVDSLLDYQT